MLPDALESPTSSPIAVHRAPIPLAADYTFTLARHFDRRIVSCRIEGR
jgi:hypothetical protein